MREARAALEKARLEESARYAPEVLKQADETLRRARRSEILESARLPFLRDYRGTKALARQARLLAGQALRLAERRRGESERDARAEVASLREFLERSRELKRFLSPRNSEISRLQMGAEVDLDLAQRRLLGKDYPGALELARSGSDRIHQVEQILLSSMVSYTAHPDLPLWRKWVEEALYRSRRDGEVAFVVDKLRRRMTVYRGGRKQKTYSVDIGLGGLERKMRAGDDATPEGLYRIQEIRGPGQTRYHRAFLLDYPNKQDRQRFEEARRNGRLPQGADPGGLIEIHGEGGREQDWTRGCVALTNAEMDELSRWVKVGTPVAIVGYNPRDREERW
jgi:L,D-transpeptidase catalytic domain